MGEGQLAEGEATDAEVDLHAPSPRQSRGTLAAAAHQAGGRLCGRRSEETVPWRQQQMGGA